MVWTIATYNDYVLRIVELRKCCRTTSRIDVDTQSLRIVYGARNVFPLLKHHLCQHRVSGIETRKTYGISEVVSILGVRTVKSTPGGEILTRVGIQAVCHHPITSR